jgi:mannose/cellobiose epimerase-like protein (N-acyl-D-glucosamine 2-epimerase family)
MIRANCLLHEATSEAKYLAEAHRMAEAAALRWIDVETGAIRDAGRFAHMLLEALSAVDRSTGKPRWRDLTQKCVAYVHANLRDSRGHYGSRWDREPREPWRRFELLDQASAARAFFHAATDGEAVPGND